MVNSTLLALTQSPISSLIPSVGNTVTVKLDDTNYVTWNFQMDLLLEGNEIMGFIDGNIPCPEKFGETDSEDGVVDTVPMISDAYKVWKIHDKALMTLLAATLSSSALSCIIGSQSSKEMWTNLRQRFASTSRTSIVQMKIDLQNIKKGPDTIDQYLQRIKDFRDQLVTVGITISDEDIVIVALRGLPSEYNTIKAVIRGRENLVSLTELRSQLKAEESTLDEATKQVPLMTAMLAHGSGSVYESGSSSGSSVMPPSSFTQYPVQSMPPMQAMSTLHSMQSMHNLQPISYPQMFPAPVAYATQHTSGSYNNFCGNNYKAKGKGEKFYFNSQTSPQSQFGSAGSTVVYSTPVPQIPHTSGYNLSQICQICDRNGHSALNCFQKGCQICNRVGHTAATCFDRQNASTHFSSPSSPYPQYYPSSVMPHSQQFSTPQNYVSHPPQSSSSYQHPSPHVAMTARTVASSSAPQQEFWLVDSGATNHMTSDISNLQEAVPYPSSETVAGAGGEGQGHRTNPLQRIE